MSSSSAVFSLDHLSPHPSDQLRYVHCNFCNTVLAVCVPCSSLFKTTVTVRCGHCANLLSVNMLHLTCHFLSPPNHDNLLDEIAYPPPPASSMMDHYNNSNYSNNLVAPPNAAIEEVEHSQAPIVNRPPEKRQRVPSAYNRFIKDEIQRIKASNPDISHREAFSAAAKNWAHYPHIHFGLMPEQTLKKNSIRQQEGEDVHGFYAAANLGVSAANGHRDAFFPSS